MTKIQIGVVGGGAAGFMGAIAAAEKHGHHASITIFEKNRAVLSKVRVSGGGRCNVTNAAATLPQLCAGYPRGAKFLRPLFEIFNNHDTVAWFEKRGVALKTEPDGRVFPTTDRSETIINCLLNAAQRAGIEVKTSCAVAQICPTESGRFRLTTADATTHEFDRVLITSGGHPQSTGYDWLAQLGLSVVVPTPSLFTFNVPESPFHALSGVAVKLARVRVAGTKLDEQGPLLFTHFGLSGPSVLRTSAWGARTLAEKNYAFTALANFTTFKTDQVARQALEEARQDLRYRLKFVHTLPFADLPHRLWVLLLEMSHIPDTMRWADLPAKNLNRLAEHLTNCPFLVRGKTTFKEEFVTCGGIDLNEIDPQTLESKKLKGLFFAGEVLDIDGITGGYNFQSAWTTGYVAGQGMVNA
ncbi:MAG: NAD(P)/FAD-dependent oxidoreductase [Runella slithyformis]|nr:MAG: NAD(P)/FAD-dependent oxidoreductase [Runella slithyformis]TAF25695.1 MAG: NAD(P)/FAD-dependent oxidoreductase [Runella slithyformis]TAF44092.1 MAG: NAD(P)/FAD-dependent oxidoreductase [Runella slithyformis]TAH08284.1 MAG: NAD(P)/FAD-dependent oxidoreductase [Runella slithyformis]